MVKAIPGWNRLKPEIVGTLQSVKTQTNDPSCSVSDEREVCKSSPQNFAVDNSHLDLCIKNLGTEIVRLKRVADPRISQRLSP